MSREREERVFEDVLIFPGRLWKKYCSWGGMSVGGVGVLFFLAPFGRPGPRFDGVAVGMGFTSDTLTPASIISSTSSSSSSLFSDSSSSQICCARLSSSSRPLSSLRSPATVRSRKFLVVFLRADRSASSVMDSSISSLDWRSSTGALNDSFSFPFGLPLGMAQTPCRSRIERSMLRCRRS